MSVSISPVLNGQVFNANGSPLVGGKIFTYLAGSSTPATTYTDSAGLVAQANPIILNTRGETDNLIWITDDVGYKFVLMDSSNNTIRTIDNVLNSSPANFSQSEWIDYKPTATYINASQFSVAGDQTSIFVASRRLKFKISAGTVYGYVSAASFSTVTTVTVIFDSGNLDVGLSGVAYSLTFQIKAPLDGRNLIIGGDFDTNPWQRGTSIPIPPANSLYTADRFVVTCVGGGAVTASKQSDAPSFASSGVFSSSCLQYLVTTADTSLVTTDRYFIYQGIEGYRIAKLGFGQAGTRFATLSFWVKSSVAGVYCVAFQNASTRSYIKEYTVNTANTWEKKVITIPVDTAGTWATDNSLGLGIQFMLAAGSSYVGAADSWLSGDFRVTSNQVNFMATVGNSFKVDLIQFESGSVNTPFEYLDGDAVALDCYRYYYRHSVAVGTYAEGVTSATDSVYLLADLSFPALMRIQPTANTANANFTSSLRASLSSVGTYVGGAFIHYAVSNGSTGFRAYGIMSAGFIEFNAEL